MTAQPPLPLAPAEAVPVGAAAGLVEDAEGGRVWLHGNLWLAWDVGDEVTRRLAATQLVATRAAAATAVAEAFGVNRETLRRWGSALAQAGVVGLVSDSRGPKGPSRLTTDVVADIGARRAEGASLRAIAEATGVSVTSVRRALAAEAEPVEEGAVPVADAGIESSDPPASAARAIDVDGEEAVGQVGAEETVETADERAGLPVLADPDGRGAERGLARWGLLGQADPVFTGAARVPLAGLLFALPGLDRSYERAEG